MVILAFESPQSYEVAVCARLRFVNPGGVSTEDRRTFLMFRIFRI
jgi:hypothetical protein